MIGYKATNNFKCRNQEYKIGKTYTSDKLNICQHGFHFCGKMDDTLNYYNPSKDFVLLEVEILGEVINDGDKSVTNKLKVIRIIPKEEYSVEMLKRFSTYDYDDRGNMISQTYPNGNKYTYEYDDRGNMISMTYPSGRKTTYEYDDRGNMISETYPDGRKWTYEYEYDDRGNMISETDSDGNKTRYDDRGNMISETDSNGDTWIYEYDDRGNMISETDPNGYKITYEYDDRGNMISETDPYGYKYTYDVTNVTEED
jgi:YD repeat-containing protein